MFGLFKAKSKPNQVDENPLKSQRFNDGIIIVTQDNENRSLNIEAANMNALNMLGYNQDDILDNDLRDFVSGRIVDELNEYLEFKKHGKDLDKVIGRVNRFKMRKQDDEMLPLRVRVVRSLSTKSHPRFQVILNDDTLIHDIEENREKYRANLRGSEIFDKNTGLLSHGSIEKDFELIAFYAEKRDIKSTAVTIDITDYKNIEQSHSEEIVKKLAREVAEIINKAKRDHDLAGILGESKFLLILTETPQDKVTFPVERIKRLLGEKDFGVKAKFEVSTTTIEKDSKIESLL